MRDVYTAVLNRPEGSSFSGLLYESTSSSDYQILSSFNKERLVERVAELTATAALNAKKYEYYEEYEVIFLFNGFDESGDICEEIDEIYEIKSNIDVLYDMWCYKHEEYFEKALKEDEEKQLKLLSQQKKIADAEVRLEELKILKHLSEKYKDINKD